MDYFNHVRIFRDDTRIDLDSDGDSPSVTVYSGEYLEIREDFARWVARYYFNRCLAVHTGSTYYTLKAEYAAREDAAEAAAEPAVARAPASNTDQAQPTSSIHALLNPPS